MGTKIVVALIVMIYILFLLSVFAPMHSRKKFWVIIQKIRGIMDLAVYWFFNLCGIATIVFVICMVIRSLLKLAVS